LKTIVACRTSLGNSILTAKDLISETNTTIRAQSNLLHFTIL
jgi:hypothetical protein